MLEYVRKHYLLWKGHEQAQTFDTIEASRSAQYILAIPRKQLPCFRKSLVSRHSCSSFEAAVFVFVKKSSSQLAVHSLVYKAM